MGHQSSFMQVTRPETRQSATQIIIKTRKPDAPSHECWRKSTLFIAYTQYLMCETPSNNIIIHNI